MTCQLCGVEKAIYNYSCGEKFTYVICEKCKDILLEEHMYEHSIGKFYFEPIPKTLTKERK